MTQQFPSTASPGLVGAEAPAFDAFLVVPSDSAALAQTARALYVGVGGNVALITLAGTTVTFVGVPTGQILPVRCTQVMNTNTTASGIIALV